MLLEFVKHEKPNTYSRIKSVKVKTEKQAIKIVKSINFPTGTTAIVLVNETSNKKGLFYKQDNGMLLISWWQGYNWQVYRNEFKGKKNWDKC